MNNSFVNSRISAAFAQAIACADTTAQAAVVELLGQAEQLVGKNPMTAFNVVIEAEHRLRLAQVALNAPRRGDRCVVRKDVGRVPWRHGAR